jgi:hypothetical protein
LFAPISALAAAVLVAVSTIEKAPALREEVCGELKLKKVNFLSFLQTVSPSPSCHD